MPKGKSAVGEAAPSLAAIESEIEGLRISAEEAPPPTGFERRSPSIRRLAAKLADIIGEVGAIKHDSKSAPEQGSYSYTSYDAITGRLRGLLAKRSIAILFDEVSCEQSREFKTRSGVVWPVMRVVADITLVDGESGEWITLRFSGEGADNSDKHIPKCYTMIEKYAFKMLFLVSTGADDVEADARTGEGGNGVDEEEARRKAAEVAAAREAAQRPINEDQRAVLESLVRETGADLREFLKFFNARSLVDFPLIHFNKALSMLERKRGGVS